METNDRDNKGKFVKGHRGFKPKGAINHTTREVKEKFNQLLESYPLEQMIADLQELKPRERLSVIKIQKQMCKVKLRLLMEASLKGGNQMDWSLKPVPAITNNGALPYSLKGCLSYPTRQC